MDDESGESMELMEEMPLKVLGEAELERLVRVDGGRGRELIPETRASILKGTICYSYRRWRGWTSECDER